jgi:hypothetical protein
VPPPQWFAPLPSGFARATKVSLMRAEFGTLGVALPMIMLAEAEAQKQMGGRRGVIKATYVDLAHLTASDVETVRRAVERWSELGEFVDATFRAHDFDAHWRDWDKWQPLPPALAGAIEFLYESLSGGMRPSADVEADAKAKGISPRTLDRARTELGVASCRQGGEWFMSLPSV